jgi:nitrate/nitrite transport system ATP-binding protein
LGTAPAYTRPGFLDPYDRGDGSQPQNFLNYNQFYVNKTNCPDRVEALWTMIQMARWGLVDFPRNWVEVIDRTWRADIFGQAARELNLLDVGRDRRPIVLGDGTVFNPDDPIHYLNSLEIKRDIKVVEVSLDALSPV